MTSDAFAIIAVWILTGMGFGMFATGYGACRKVYRQVPGITQLLDWLWFVIAAAGFLVMLFWTEWGTFRLSSLGFVLVGYGLWTWLAAPLVLPGLVTIARLEAQLMHGTLGPIRWLMHRVSRSFLRLKKPPREE